MRWQIKNKKRRTSREGTGKISVCHMNELFLVFTLYRNGFEEEQIEALLHKIEIQMKHQSTNFGLALASVSSQLFLSPLPKPIDMNCISVKNAKISEVFIVVFALCLCCSTLRPHGTMTVTQWSCCTSMRASRTSSRPWKKTRVSSRIKSDSTLRWVTSMLSSNRFMSAT